MSTHGRLDDAQIKLLGGGKRKKELVFRRLWIEKGTEGVLINDWAEHNDKRDEKRGRPSVNGLLEPKNAKNDARTVHRTIRRTAASVSDGQRPDNGTGAG